MRWNIDATGMQYKRINGDLYTVTYRGQGTWETRREGHWLGDDDTEQAAKDRALRRAGDFRQALA